MCVTEFFWNDVSDAMIVRRTEGAAFAQVAFKDAHMGAHLVTTVWHQLKNAMQQAKP